MIYHQKAERAVYLSVSHWMDVNRCRGLCPRNAREENFCDCCNWAWVGQRTQMKCKQTHMQYYIFLTHCSCFEKQRLNGQIFTQGHYLICRVFKEEGKKVLLLSFAHLFSIGIDSSWDFKLAVIDLKLGMKIFTIHSYIAFCAAGPRKIINSWPVV